ncbi:MAG: hypothetical protein KDA45_06535 [Planctomycetales bacterium]|nr:hypothetical protein [Planctomycetales bacterium]
MRAPNRQWGTPPQATVGGNLRRPWMPATMSPALAPATLNSGKGFN